MRTIKYRVTEPMPGQECGNIIECLMIFEGSMGDGIILHLGKGTSSLEVVTLTDSDDVYETAAEPFINIATTPEFLNMIDALKIMS